MSYRRSKLLEFVLVAVFGVGGGFYVFQPAFKQYQIDQTAAGKIEGKPAETK